MEAYDRLVQLVGDVAADVAQRDDLGVDGFDKLTADSPASLQDAVADPPALWRRGEAEGIPDVDHHVARGGPGPHQPGG